MPYPNEHSARLRAPGGFSKKKTAWGRTKGGKIYGRIIVPSSVSIIWGKLKGKDKPGDMPLPQALRFPKASWTAATARKWLKDNNVKYIKFEPAAKAKASDSQAIIKTEEADTITMTSKLLLSFDGEKIVITSSKEADRYVAENR